MRNQVSSSTRCPRAHFSGSSSPSTSTAADRSPSLVLHPSRQVHLPHAHAPRSRSSAASAAVKPPTMVLLEKHSFPPSSVRRSWGATVAGDFVSRGRSAVPAHHALNHRGVVTTVGIGGEALETSSTTASPFRPGPGGISIHSSHNHADRARTTPRENRGVGRLALRDRGETPARLSYLLVYINPRGVFQRAVSGSRYTLSDPQVSQSICRDHSFWAAQGLSIMHSAHALDLVFGRLVLGHQSCPSQSTKISHTT